MLSAIVEIAASVVCLQMAECNHRRTGDCCIERVQQVNSVINWDSVTESLSTGYSSELFIKTWLCCTGRNAKITLPSMDEPSLSAVLFLAFVLEHDTEGKMIDCFATHRNAS